MAYSDPPLGTLKRKRRRRADKPPISAKLQLDENLQGDLAELSTDLINDLYPSYSDQDEVVHVAISLWTPSASKSTQWTILPCKAASNADTTTAHSRVRVPTSMAGVQALLRTLQLNVPFRQNRVEPVIEIRVTDVSPLPLETIYISLDYEELRKLDISHNQYYGGFKARPAHGHRIGILQGRRKAKEAKDAQAMTESKQDFVRALRGALGDCHILHTGDAIALPLPAHPVTHTPPPPATVTACEPVSQGLVTPKTRIIVLPSNNHADHSKHAQAQSMTKYQVTSPLTEVDEETSNEAFFTAAEDGSLPSSPEKTRDAGSDSDESEESGTDAELSDDADDMISLAAPALGSQAPGAMSSLTVATPRPFGKQTNGINTPGSVYSSMTTATLRGGQASRSRVLRTQGLLDRISDDLLYPKPLSREDEEARVYVDINILAKIGCFSGDWVHIQKAADPFTKGIAGLSMAMFGSAGIGDDEDMHDARAVKVYGLPESMSIKPARYALGTRSGRRDSISSVQPTVNTTASIHMSPILLANLGDPSHLRISPMRMPEANMPPHLARNKSKIASTLAPPFAKEVTMLKLSTPLSTERSLQPNMFTSLQDYFEEKHRIVKSGDLIAIPIDPSLGRAVFEGGTAEEDLSYKELLMQFAPSRRSSGQKTTESAMGVTWFQVGDVTHSSKEDHDEPDLWNGLVSLDPSQTRMNLIGSEQKRLPPTMTNAWQYYEGVSKPPTGPDTTSAIPSVMPLLYTSQLQRRLRELMAAGTSPRAIHLGLPPIAILLTSTQRNIGKAYSAGRACSDLGMHFFPMDAYDILSEATSGGSDVKTETLFKTRAERALACGAQHTCILVRHIDALNSDRMTVVIKEVLSESRVLIATTTAVDKVPDAIRGIFTHELEMSAPDEAEREGILRSVIANSSLAISPSVDLSSVAVKTAALVAGDLEDVVDRAVAAQAVRLETLAQNASTATGNTTTVHDIKISGGDSALSLTAADFDLAVDEARKNFADSIGAPKIPNVQWSDVGGLANVKDAVIETIQLPLSRPELFAKGLKKRSGILFYGPPGTGKTLLAKAIATEFSLNFFSVKGPELLNMYIGESEANVRRVFQRARDARPCVVFFDELDSVAPKRGNQGDSGGVMDRIVSQLLAELDGMSDGDEEGGGGGGGVFVIGATNRPDLLDQALLRPGRFDKMLYLGVSDTHEKQLKILEALSRKYVVTHIIPF